MFQIFVFVIFSIQLVDAVSSTGCDDVSGLIAVLKNTIGSATNLINQLETCSLCNSPMPPTCSKNNFPDSPVMTDEYRNFLLGAINGFRSKVAKGQYSNGLKSFPSGKNINKLAWNCDLEAEARKTWQSCSFVINPAYEFWGALKDTYFPNMTDPNEIGQSVIDAMGINYNPSFATDNSNSTHVSYWSFSTLMNDKLESFACWYGTTSCDMFAYPSSKTQPVLVCGGGPSQIIRSNPAQWVQPNYAIGPACTADNQCTNPNGFTKCDVTLGLCTNV